MAVCVVGIFTTFFSKVKILYRGFVWVYTLDSVRKMWKTKGKNRWCYVEIGVGKF